MEKWQLYNQNVPRTVFFAKNNMCYLQISNAIKLIAELPIKKTSDTCNICHIFCMLIINYQLILYNQFKENKGNFEDQKTRI